MRLQLDFDQNLFFEISSNPVLDLFEPDSINDISVRSRQNFDSKAIRFECVIEKKLILMLCLKKYTKLWNKL